MRGTPSTSASMFTPKLVCNGVCLNRLLRTTLALASRLSSITSLGSWLADALRSSLMPSRSPARTSSVIFCSITSTDVWYGSSVTTMRSPTRPSSISATARILMEPRPVRYASRMPWRPRISAPVGKSGPLTNSISSSGVASGWCSTWMAASITSPMLWGGTLVAMPTAMPCDPLTSRFGNREGRTTGSDAEPS